MVIIISIVIVVILAVVLSSGSNNPTPEQLENIRIANEQQNNPELLEQFISDLHNKYDSETVEKILAGTAFIGMTEKQFDELLELQFYKGQNYSKNAFPNRQETILKTKTKVLRKKNRHKFRGDQEFQFDDGVLVKIKTF